MCQDLPTSNTLHTFNNFYSLALRDQSLVGGKLVNGLQDIWVVARAEDLLLASLPLWLVDGVNPVLDFHDDTAIVSNGTGTAGIVEEALGLLDWDSVFCGSI